MGFYQDLLRLHEEEGLDISNVVTFNLDEYYPKDPESLQSYHRFMAENFFDHAHIPEENIHIPRGDIPREEVERHCIEYEHAIEKAGGIDLMLLGIGRSGHVGFNEPGSGPHTRTRIIILDELTREVFEDLRQRFKYREDLISDESVIVFSPHPDDDVISMGGMLDKLVDNDNEGTVAYMTSGNVAVFDADVRRYLRFIDRSSEALDLSDENLEGFKERCEKIVSFLEAKEAGEIDLPQVQDLKANIRAGEAIAATEVMGSERIYPLPRHAVLPDGASAQGSPFRGRRRGRPRATRRGRADAHLRGWRPVGPTRHAPHVLPGHPGSAGSISAAHGRGERRALGARLSFRPLVWLYRGAWQEWEIHRADIFIPLSKADLDRKVEAIFKHESQKDRAMFSGGYDDREFWQRPRDRNRRTADTLNQLGLPEFYATEAFVTTYEMP